MPSNHLILYHPLLLPPSIIPSIRVFSNESVLHIRWPKDWSFSFSISPSNEHSGWISFRAGNSPSYKWGPQGRETLGNLSRITQRVTCGARIFPHSHTPELILIIPMWCRIFAPPSEIHKLCFYSLVDLYLWIGCSFPVFSITNICMHRSLFSCLFSSINL